MTHHWSPASLAGRAVALLCISFVTSAQAAQPPGSQAAATALDQLAQAGLALDYSIAGALTNSHCNTALAALINGYLEQRGVREALEQAGAGLKDLPPGYNASDMPSMFENQKRGYYFPSVTCSDSTKRKGLLISPCRTSVQWEI